MSAFSSSHGLAIFLKKEWVSGFLKQPSFVLNNTGHPFLKNIGQLFVKWFGCVAFQTRFKTIINISIKLCWTQDLGHLLNLLCGVIMVKQKRDSSKASQIAERVCDSESPEISPGYYLKDWLLISLWRTPLCYWLYLLLLIIYN